jgi:catechol 2,3-dioxygenase-like lactoylglutathione lyase family enzyme
MPKISGIRPMLETKDLRGTIAFWSDLLGFVCNSTFGEDPNHPTWASLGRDGVNLMFTTMHTHEEGADHDHDHPSEPVMTGSLYVDIDDVDALALDLGGKVPLLWGPVDTAYDMREIAITDPNGYLIIFGQPVESGG